MKYKLTKKEQKESVFMTLGRLSVAIKNNDTERALLLKNKITKDVSEMDMELWRIKNEL